VVIEDAGDTSTLHVGVEVDAAAAFLFLLIIRHRL
jgi:hypothetical protein